MGKIVIYKNLNNICVKYNDNDYLFSYEILNNIINEEGIPCKISTLNVDTNLVNKICSILRSNNLDVKSFNAFSNKGVDKKYIIKIKEKKLINIK